MLLFFICMGYYSNNISENESKEIIAKRNIEGA